MHASNHSHPSPSPLPADLKSLHEARRVLDALIADHAAVASIESIAAALIAAFKAGRKVLIAGNGGSLCDAAHFAEELTGRFRADRAPLPAIAITDPGHITCTANDYGFDHIFARSVEALGQSGDILILLSTSGNSSNCLKALDVAVAKGLSTVGLLGKGGGALRGRCTHEVVVAGETSDRIQELHMLILHILVERIEVGLFGRS